MLQKLRDQTQSLFFKVLVGLIVFVLAVFGFGAFNLFVTADRTVASVNGEDITETMLVVEAQREQRRLAARFGEGFDPSLIDPVQLQNAVLEQLIGRQLLEQAMNDLGIGVSAKQVNASVASNPNFVIDGKFEEDIYRRTVVFLGFTPQTYLETTERLLAMDQLRAGLSGTAFLTDWELRTQARLLNQRRDLAYLPFTQEIFADKIQLSEEDIALRYEENRLDYMSEEQVDVAFVELTVESLMNDPSIVVIEEDVLAAYELDKAAAISEEQRDSRHILLEVTEARSAESAESEMRALKARIDAGESFSDIAIEYSEDPGSAAAGGELGLVSKGLFDAEFERVLWNLTVGEISEPVRTEFGYHLIQLNEVVINEFPGFETLREELESRIRRGEAGSLFVQRVREMDSLAFEQPDSLDGIASQFGLEVRTADGISRTEGTGLFGNVQLRESVFADEVLTDGFNSPAVEYLESRAVVARVVERHEPAQIPLEEVQDRVRDEIVAERARAEIGRAHDEALQRVSDGENVSVVANDFGLEWQTAELARRGQPGVPPSVLEVAFSLPRPIDPDKRVGTARTDTGDQYVVTVTRVEDGDLSAMTEVEIDGVRRFLAGRASNLDFEGFYNTLEQEASIKRP